MSPPLQRFGLVLCFARSRNGQIKIEVCSLARYRIEGYLEITRIVNCRNLVGESPLWHPEESAIYWTDINGFRIQRLVPQTGRIKSWQFSEPACAISLTTAPGWLLVALASKLILWSPIVDERLEFAHPDPDLKNRLNDGASDPNGVYWVGSMRNNIAPNGSPIEFTENTGSLYRIDAQGEVSVWDTGYGIANTMAWSPDYRTFYCACSIRNIIYAYDYDVSDSSIRNRRIFAANLDRGVPDGSAVDAEGFLWNCRFFGKCILRIAPNGKVDRVIEMPASNITHCAFGGPDLKTLYVTSASIGAPPGEKAAGDLFSIDSGVRGIPVGRFRISDKWISKFTRDK